MEKVEAKWTGRSAEKAIESSPFASPESRPPYVWYQPCGCGIKASFYVHTPFLHGRRYFQTRTLEDVYKFVGLRSLIQGCTFLRSIMLLIIQKFSISTIRSLIHGWCLAVTWKWKWRHGCQKSILGLKKLLKTTSLHTTKVSPQRTNVNAPVPHSDPEIRSTQELKSSVLHWIGSWSKLRLLGRPLCRMFDIDWVGLSVPFAYIAVLVGSLITFSSVYRKRKAVSIPLGGYSASANICSPICDSAPCSPRTCSATSIFLCYMKSQQKVKRRRLSARKPAAVRSFETRCRRHPPHYPDQKRKASMQHVVATR